MKYLLCFLCPMFVAGLTPVACSLSVKGRHLHPVAVYCSHKELGDGKCVCGGGCMCGWVQVYVFCICLCLLHAVLCV